MGEVLVNFWVHYCLVVVVFLVGGVGIFFFVWGGCCGDKVVV